VQLGPSFPKNTITGMLVTWSCEHYLTILRNRGVSIKIG
jgi:hypothetical protein